MAKDRDSKKKLLGNIFRGNPSVGRTPYDDKKKIYFFKDNIINNKFIDNKIIYKDNKKIDYLNNIILKKNYYKIPFSITAQSINLIGVGDITAENLGEYVLPLVEYIRQMQPDCIIACDRGARPIGVAVSIMYHLMYGALPTTDGTLRFARISHSNSRNATREHLRPLVEKILEERGKARVLVLDDWVASGSTKNLTKSLFEELSNGRIEVKFGVLCGGGADIYGTRRKHSVEWHDRPEVIGVDYKGMKAIMTHSREHKKFARRMAKGIRRVYKEVKEKTAKDLEETLVS